MRHLVITLIAMTAISAQARVSDFNKLINENIAAQSNIHEEVKKEVAGPALVDQTPSEIMVIGAEKRDLVAPTQKDFLRHKKELTHFKAASKVQEERIANEFEALESEF